MISTKLSQLGFEFFDDLGINMSIQEIGQGLGGIFKVPTMPLVQTLTPRSETVEPPNTYSGIFGYGEFPLHTDMAHWHVPPRYIVMRCVIPNSRVATRIVQARSVLPDPNSLVARMALFKPRRRLDNQSYFLRVSELSRWRWDSVFIKPANPIAQQLKAEIELACAGTIAEEVRFTKSRQVLILDNWTVLHGRTAVIDSTEGRVIERIYLEKTVL